MIAATGFADSYSNFGGCVFVIRPTCNSSYYSMRIPEPPKRPGGIPFYRPLFGQSWPKVIVPRKENRKASRKWQPQFRGNFEARPVLRRERE